MSLFAKLEATLKQALLARDTRKVDVLKLVKSDVLLKAKEAGLDEVPDEICQAAIYKQIQNYGEAVELLRQAGQDQAAETKQAEREILIDLLPPQLTETELAEVVDRVIRDSQLELSRQHFKDFLEAVRAEAGNGASSGQIAAILKTRLK